MPVASFGSSKEESAIASDSVSPDGPGPGKSAISRGPKLSRGEDHTPLC